VRQVVVTKKHYENEEVIYTFAQGPDPGSGTGTSFFLLLGSGLGFRDSSRESWAHFQSQMAKGFCRDGRGIRLSGLKPGS
jgi:hypothetical protein